MSAANHLLAVQLISILTKACIDDVPDMVNVKGSTKVNEVTLKRATGGVRLSLTVMHFDYVKKEGWSNTAVPRADIADGLDYPCETNTSTFERVRGSIMLSANLSTTGENQIEADEVIQEVLARARRAVLNNIGQLIGISDSYGNKVTRFKIVNDTEYDSGADTSNNTKDFIRWVAVVEVPRKYSVGA